MEQIFGKIRSSLIAHRSSLIAHRSSPHIRPQKTPKVTLYRRQLKQLRLAISPRETQKLKLYRRDLSLSVVFLRPFSFCTIYIYVLVYALAFLLIACDPPDSGGSSDGGTSDGEGRTTIAKILDSVDLGKPVFALPAASVKDIIDITVNVKAGQTAAPSTDYELLLRKRADGSYSDVATGSDAPVYIDGNKIKTRNNLTHENASGNYQVVAKGIGRYPGEVRSLPMLLRVTRASELRLNITNKEIIAPSQAGELTRVHINPGLPGKDYSLSLKKFPHKAPPSFISLDNTTVKYGTSIQWKGNSGNLGNGWGVYTLIADSKGTPNINSGSKGVILFRIGQNSVTDIIDSVNVNADVIRVTAGTAADNLANIIVTPVSGKSPVLDTDYEFFLQKGGSSKLETAFPIFPQIFPIVSTNSGNQITVTTSAQLYHSGTYRVFARGKPDAPNHYVGGVASNEFQITVQ